MKRFLDILQASCRAGLQDPTGCECAAASLAGQRLCQIEREKKKHLFSLIMEEKHGRNHLYSMRGSPSKAVARASKRRPKIDTSEGMGTSNEIDPADSAKDTYNATRNDGNTSQCDSRVAANTEHTESADAYRKRRLYNIHVRRGFTLFKIT